MTAPAEASSQADGSGTGAAFQASPKYSLSTESVVDAPNTFLRGWSNHFGYGYPRKAFRDPGNCARKRMVTHLDRRSQRKYHRPKGISHYQYLQEIGLQRLWEMLAGKESRRPADIITNLRTGSIKAPPGKPRKSPSATAWPRLGPRIHLHGGRRPGCHVGQSKNSTRCRKPLARLGGRPYSGPTDSSMKSHECLQFPDFRRRPAPEAGLLLSSRTGEASLFPSDRPTGVSRPWGKKQIPSNIIPPDDALERPPACGGNPG